MANNFQVTISAVDSASKVLDGLNKKLSALRAPADNLVKSFGKFTQLTGLTKIWQGFNNVLTTTLSSLTKMAPALGAITGAASIAGMASLVRQWADYGQQLEISASWLGVMPDKLQNMQNAMRLMGGSAADANSTIESLDHTLQDAARGKNHDAAAMLQFLGVSFRKAGLEAKSATEVMPELFDKLQQLNKSGKLNADQKRRLAEMFGLNPALAKVVFEEGWRGYQKALEETKPFDLTKDQDDVLSNLKKKISLVEIAFESFGEKVAVALGPKLAPILDKITEWFSKPENVQSMADAIEHLVQMIIDFCKWVDSAVEKMGGWKPILDAIGILLMSKMFSPLKGIVKVGLKLAALTFGGLVGELGGVARTLGEESGGGLLGKFAKLNALLIAIEAGQKALDPETYNPMNWATGSPFWRGIPREEQLKYPNSPASQETAPQGPSFLEAPGTWILNRLGFGSNPNAGARSDFQNRTMGGLGGGHTPAPVSAADLLAYFKSPAGGGWKHEHALAIVANLKGESSLDAANIGDNGASAGLAMWRDDRRELFRKMYHHDPSEAPWQEQAEFINWELTHTHREAGDRLRRSHGREGAGIVSEFYEKPAKVELNKTVRGGIYDELERENPEVPSANPPVSVTPNSNKHAMLDGKIRIDVNSKLPVVASATGNNLGAPRVVSPLVGVAA